LSTRTDSRATKIGDSIETSGRPVSRDELGSRVTILAIDQVLAELEMLLTDIIAAAKSIENGITQSGFPANGSICAE
jgi:hypothetical protein